MYITFGRRQLKLNNCSSSDFLEKLDQFLRKASSISSPGNLDYAAGEVDMEKQTFVIAPFATWSWRMFPIDAHRSLEQKGSQESIVVSFKSDLWGVLIYVGFISWVVISSGSFFFGVVLFIPMVVSLVFARFSYKKDIKRHLAFLMKFDQ